MLKFRDYDYTCTVELYNTLKLGTPSCSLFTVSRCTPFATSIFIYLFVYLHAFLVCQTKDWMLVWVVHSELESIWKVLYLYDRWQQRTT